MVTLPKEERHASEEVPEWDEDKEGLAEFDDWEDA
jgi:hypothetical protein